MGAEYRLRFNSYRLVILIGLFASCTCYLYRFESCEKILTEAEHVYSTHSGIAGNVSNEVKAINEIANCGGIEDVRILLSEASPMLRAYGAIGMKRLNKLEEVEFSDSTLVSIMQGDFVSMVELRHIPVIIQSQEW